MPDNEEERYKDFTLLKDIPSTFKVEAEDQLSDEQYKSFLNPGEIRVGTMQIGDILWRFAHGGRYIKYLFSDCWMEHKVMQAAMGIFRSWDNYSDAVKSEVIRKNFALLGSWYSKIPADNVLGWRVQIKVRVEVVAYYGVIGPQHDSKEATKVFDNAGNFVNQHIEYRVGGMPQYVIPRYKGLPNENPLAAVGHKVKFLGEKQKYKEHG